MTDKLSNYSTTPGSNNAASPDGWPEGQTAGSVNNSDREFAARVREFYEDPTWIDFGHTVVSSTASSIKLSTDLTAVYTAGRPIRVNQSGSQTGYVTASAYSAPDTSITVSGFTVSLPTQVEAGAIYSASQLPNNMPFSTTGTITAAVANITTASITSLTVSSISGSVTASQSEMEAESSSSKIVTPNVVQYSPGVAKAYGVLKFTSGPDTYSLMAGSYGVSSITTSGFTCAVTLSSPMSSSAYAVMVSSNFDYPNPTEGSGGQYTWTASKFYIAHGSVTGSFFSHLAVFGDR